MMALDAVIRVAARLVLFLVAASLLSEAVPVQAQPEVEWPAVRVVQRWSGFTKPLDVFLARDGSGRLFIVEQEGRIRIVKAGLGDASFLLTSFGENEAGNVFVTDYSNGQVYEIVPAAG